MDRVLSLSEIGEIESAYELGASSLGTAAEALLLRWKKGLRDEETAIRLIFLVWYRESEPVHLTGLDKELPSADSLIAEYGGLERFSATSLFVLGYLGRLFPYCLGDEEDWKIKVIQCFESAERSEPTSLLFREWRFFTGQADDCSSATLLLKSEIHGRFHGRGALGNYAVSVLLAALDHGCKVRGA